MAIERSADESLDRKEQAAFSELADTLIFETPLNFRLSRKTVPELARRVQDEFMRQEVRHEELKQQYVHGLVQRAYNSLKELTGKPIDEKESDPEEKKSEKKKDESEPKTQTEEFIRITKHYHATHIVDDSNPYNPWGFTPRLAGMPERGPDDFPSRTGSNCFGFVQTLGAVYREMGLDFEMGITADHPFALVQIEGKVYLSSLYGVAEAKGTFEEKDGYKIYKPAKEDKIPYELMSVWNFDEAQVYELLENFEVLRRMSLGEEVMNLPNTEESGRKLAEQHHGTLQMTSWRNIQEKVTPRIAAYFRDANTQWSLEHDRVHMLREIRHFFEEVMKASQQATSLKGLSLEEFKEQFLPLAKEHRISIVGMMFSDAAPLPDTPLDVIHFAQTAKDVISKIEISELREEVLRGFMRPFSNPDLEIVSEERLTGE